MYWLFLFMIDFMLINKASITIIDVCIYNKDNNNITSNYNKLFYLWMESLEVLNKYYKQNILLKMHYKYNIIILFYID